MTLVEYTAKSAPYGLQHSQKIPLPFTAGQLGASTTLSLKKKPKKPQTCKPHSLYLSHPVANSSSFFLAERPEQLGSGSCLQPLAPEEQLVQIPEGFLVQTAPAAAPAPGAAPGAAPAQAGESLPVFEQPGWGLMSPPGHIPADCALLVTFQQGTGVAPSRRGTGSTSSHKGLCFVPPCLAASEQS